MKGKLDLVNMVEKGKGEADGNMRKKGEEKGEREKSYSLMSSRK